MEQDALCRRFVEWYNEQSGRNYHCETAADRFPDAAFGYVLVEGNSKESWLALEFGRPDELLVQRVPGSGNSTNNLSA